MSYVKITLVVCLISPLLCSGSGSGYFFKIEGNSQYRDIKLPVLGDLFFLTLFFAKNKFYRGAGKGKGERGFYVGIVSLTLVDKVCQT